MLKVKDHGCYKIAHPSDEHFFPYLVTIGAAGDL